MISLFYRDPTPTLRDGHLVLRPATHADYEQWYRLRRESRPFLKPFEPRWSEADLAQPVFRRRIERCRQEARDGTEYSFLIFVESGRQEALVGGITLSNVRRRAAQHVSLGYWMGVHHAGKGIMSRAVGVTLPFIFDELSLHRVQAATLPHNIASRRVLEKNGFREEGYAENYLQIDGSWQDHVLFGLTRERYEGRRS